MKFSLTGTLILLLLTPLASHAQGSDYRVSTTIRISEGDSVHTNLISAGQYIEIFGYLGDDLFSASEQLLVNGHIDDDVIAAARDLSVRGKVGDMMVAAAETIIIDGEIDGDFFAAARQIRITPRAHIKGNAALAAETILFEGGQIQGWLSAAGNSFQMNGSVGNGVTLYGAEFIFGDSYSSEVGTRIKSEETISRENLGIIPPNLEIELIEPDLWPFLLFKAWFYLSILVTGLVFILVFKQTARDLYYFANERILKNAGIGLLVFLGMPVALFVLLLLIFTVPLAVVLGLVYGLILFFSYLLVSLVIGTNIIAYFREDISTSAYAYGLTIGLVLVAIFNNIPFIGGIVTLLLLFFGLGSISSYLWKTSRNN